MLTTDQIKSNIDAMQAQGASNSDIQGWLDSLPKPASTPTNTGTPQGQPPTTLDKIGGQLNIAGIPGTSGFLKGALKGIGSTARSIMGLGEKIAAPVEAAAAKITGTKQFPLLFQGEKPQILQPQGTAQNIGFGTEQIAEFLIPTDAEEKALSILSDISPKIAEAAKSGSVLAKMAQFGAKSLGSAAEFAGKTLLQTGGPGTGPAAVMGALAPGVSKVAGAITKGLTEILPERLYSTIFKTAESDLRSYYQSVAKEATPNQTLAKEMLDRGVFGSSKNMAVYSIQKLDSLEKQVQDLVMVSAKDKPAGDIATKTIKLPNKNAFVNMLEDVAGTFKRGFYNDKAKEAQQLANEIKTSGGELFTGDVLRLRRFMDRMRNTSSFRMNANLGPRQAEFKDAADMLRSKLADFPQLKSLMNEERVFIQGLDSIIEDASKRQNRDVINLTDAILGGGGLATGWGLGPEVVVRGFRLPSIRTGLAQGLYQSRKLTQAIAPATKQIPKAITPLIR